MHMHEQLETLAVADIDVEGGVYDVPLWIIIISIIAGFLLLTIVIVLLWKVAYYCWHHRCKKRE